eukprot:gene23545-10381_t
MAHAGKLSKVTIGGQPWTAFNAAEETVDISAEKLTAALIAKGLPTIVATFEAKHAVPLLEARYIPANRVIPTLPPAAAEVLLKPQASAKTSVRNPPTALADAAAPTAPAIPAAPAVCPDKMEEVDHFDINGTGWLACEDLHQPGGSIALVPATGDVEWFSKAYSPYKTVTDDGSYYLGLTKQTVAAAKTDVLGAKLLEQKFITWADVEKAIPPIRTASAGGGCSAGCPGGVRTFVGSRGASVDTTMDNQGNDCNYNGWPHWDTYAIGEHNKAVKEPPQVCNESEAADGIVGDVLPTAIFYLPMQPNGTSKFRYWTVTAVPVADMQGSREQSVWFRYQQIECSGLNKKPPFPGSSPAEVDAETLKTGPIKASSAAGFYANLLENKRWWAAELKAEGMMDLSLPSPATTNGTWLKTQAVHGIVKNMITRQRTWQPRYGVCPGYGAVVYHGVPDVFTSTATAALEFGAMPYAKGVIDYQFKHYIRTDGMVWHRATELPATARMLTILALYHTYSNDDALLLEHFAKAQGVAEWLAGRRSATLHYGKDDPRYGIPGGNDGVVNTEELMNHVAEPLHWYASAAELYRACSEMGVVWAKVGAKNGRKDIAAHGAVLLDLAGELYHDLHVSMNRTVKVSSAGERCWQAAAEPSVNGQDDTFRGYAEMLYSGALTAQQAADIYLAASGRSSCSTSRYLVAGSPGLRNTPTIATPASYGFAQGLLQNDEIEKFLLHFFAISAHGYTRGTWTTPESSNIADRDIAPVAYSSAGVVVVPTYLKWMLCFEEPETRTLWLGKAVPRDWLAAGEAPLNAQNVT